MTDYAILQKLERTIVEDSRDGRSRSRAWCRVRLRVFEDQVHVGSSRVAKKERKKGRKDSGRHLAYEVVPQWPTKARRRARLTSSLEVKASFERVLDVLFEEICLDWARLHCLSSLETRLRGASTVTARISWD